MLAQSPEGFASPGRMPPSTPHAGLGKPAANLPAISQTRQHAPQRETRILVLWVQEVLAARNIRIVHASPITYKHSNTSFAALVFIQCLKMTSADYRLGSG